MKYQSIMLSKKWCFILFFILLYGCTANKYLENHTREWVARPLSALKQSMKSPDSYASKVGWKETTYPLANGNSVFIEPVSKGCSIHWEVSPRGTIIGFKIEDGCKDGTSAIDTITAPSDRW
jgi:hypothetical protein